MKKGNINWEQFAKELLWHNIVYHKYEKSGYEQQIDKPDSEIGLGIYSLSSIVSNSGKGYRVLNWRDLAVELGLFEDILVPDGHNCWKCPEGDTCKAHFKYDLNQETCEHWKTHYKDK